MPRQTRKARNSRGQRGGATAALKMPGITTAAEFKAAYGLYYLGAHGLMTERIVKVPANTYIVFVAPAGEVCEPTGKDMRMYDSMILGRRYKTEDELLAGWLAVLKGETASAPMGFSLYSSKAGAGSAAASTVAIYEPGDSFYDLNLDFSNTLQNRFIDMGLYEAPLAANYLGTCERVWGYFDKKYPSGDIPVKDVGKLTKFYAEGDTVYAGRPDNMMKLRVQAANLSTLLGEGARLGITWPAGKKRIIVVNACRIPMSEVTEKEMKATARRLSLSQRRYSGEKAAAAAAAPKAKSPPKEAATAPSAKKPSGFKSGFLTGKKPT
jgi:hypothetical protein